MIDLTLIMSELCMFERFGFVTMQDDEANFKLRGDNVVSVAGSMEIRGNGFVVNDGFLRVSSIGEKKGIELVDYLVKMYSKGKSYMTTNAFIPEFEIVDVSQKGIKQNTKNVFQFEVRFKIKFRER